MSYPRIALPVQYAAASLKVSFQGDSQIFSLFQPNHIYFDWSYPQEMSCRAHRDFEVKSQRVFDMVIEMRDKMRLICGADGKVYLQFRCILTDEFTFFHNCCELYSLNDDAIKKKFSFYKLYNKVDDLLNDMSQKHDVSGLNSEVHSVLVLINNLRNDRDVGLNRQSLLNLMYSKIEELSSGSRRGFYVIEEESKNKNFFIYKDARGQVQLTSMSNSSICFLKMRSHICLVPHRTNKNRMTFLWMPGKGYHWGQSSLDHILKLLKSMLRKRLVYLIAQIPGWADYSRCYVDILLGSLYTSAEKRRLGLQIMRCSTQEDKPELGVLLSPYG